MPPSFFRSTQLLFQFRIVSGSHFTGELDWCTEVDTVIENYVRLHILEKKQN